MFIDALKSKGYNAITDLNDYGSMAEDPLIVFDIDELISKISMKKIKQITNTHENNSKRQSNNGKEFDTYKIATVANSCSTMHKIAAKEFTLEDFSHEHICIRQSTDILKETIDALNVIRDVYLNGGILRYENGNMKCFGKKDKDIWWQMIQLLPSSYNQTRNVMLNYEVLANIYRQRKNHKLDEWIEFCKWIETLPYSELITGEGKEN